VYYLIRFIAHKEAVKRGPNKSIVSDVIEELLINSVIIIMVMIEWWNGDGRILLLLLAVNGDG
jgi:hypothetical protein